MARKKTAGFKPKKIVQGQAKPQSWLHQAWPYSEEIKFKGISKPVVFEGKDRNEIKAIYNKKVIAEGVVRNALVKAFNLKCAELTGPNGVIYVNPAFRRKGILTEMVARFEAAARQQGFKGLVAGVQADNEAMLAAVGKFGFKEIDKFYWDPHEQPRIIFFKKLS
ncbi:GNAT family N-acetyltransferase [archaeon]|nr:GNAT family N-acetyltransferase [archaeon]